MRLCYFCTPAGYPRCSPVNTRTNFGETKASVSSPAILSEPFFFDVVNVEPVVHHPVTRNELLDVILHVLLKLQRQIAQVQIAFFVIPGDDLGAWTFFGAFANPCRNLIVGCAGGDERPEVVVVDLREPPPALLEWAIGMVFAFP